MTMISKTTIVAFGVALSSFAGQAQAHTVIRWLPRSGVPYSVPHEEPQAMSRVRHFSANEAKAERTLHFARLANKSHKANVIAAQ